MADDKGAYTTPSIMDSSQGTNLMKKDSYDDLLVRIFWLFPGRANWGRTWMTEAQVEGWTRPAVHSLLLKWLLTELS